MADRRSLQRVEILTIEGFRRFKPLWRIVVASGGSKFLKVEDIGFVKPLWQALVASGGSKSSKLKALDF